MLMNISTLQLLQDVESGIRRLLALEDDIKNRLKAGAQRTQELQKSWYYSNLHDVHAVLPEILAGIKFGGWVPNCLYKDIWQFNTGLSYI